MQVKPIKTKIFKEGENLDLFLCANIKKLKENSVVVVSSKIASLSQKRTRYATNEELHTLIEKEADFFVKPNKRYFTIHNGMLTTVSGIDKSNGNGKVILLPQKPFEVAKSLRNTLMKKFNVKNIGVLLVDSRSIPMRRGIVAQALGYAGFKGLGDSRGKKDLFGRKIKYARPNVADSLGGVANLVMGEAGESQPLVIIENAPICFVEKINKKELLVTLQEDKFSPFYKEIVKKKII